MRALSPSTPLSSYSCGVEHLDTTVIPFKMCPPESQPNAATLFRAAALLRANGLAKSMSMRTSTSTGTARQMRACTPARLSVSVDGVLIELQDKRQLAIASHRLQGWGWSRSLDHAKTAPQGSTNVLLLLGRLPSGATICDRLNVLWTQAERVQASLEAARRGVATGAHDDAVGLAAAVARARPAAEAAAARIAAVAAAATAEVAVAKAKQEADNATRLEMASVASARIAAAAAAAAAAATRDARSIHYSHHPHPNPKNLHQHPHQHPHPHPHPHQPPERPPLRLSVTLALPPMLEKGEATARCSYSQSRLSFSLLDCDPFDNSDLLRADPVLRTHYRRRSSVQVPGSRRRRSTRNSFNLIDFDFSETDISCC